MNVLVDDIGIVIARMRTVVDGPPYYMFGHKLEVARELLIKESNPDEQAKKYPLIILAMDTPEENFGKMIHYDLTIAIVDYTKPEYLTEERYTNVFKPILYPLYESFFVELRKSGLFCWPNIGRKPMHTKTDRPYWGVAYNKAGVNVEKVFSDPLDAIEITKLKINQNIKC